MIDTKMLGAAVTILGKRTTTTPFHFNFHDAEVGHSVVIAPSSKGMSVMYDTLHDELSKAGGTVQVFDKGQSRS
ncbi:hypothetical protein [Cupriavidus nantongensis]|uniref:Uncharacterized protein n=1 Tax=Cupriavidus nantongensis TaxID=1796606 RepID=A0A142JIN2_9BURK|nr:hypothetical protein [Cupriavidus nantongensis]AMR77944.1 hypothetical protein A2G96_09435 [Cupriavidus nantongensis]